MSADAVTTCPRCLDRELREYHDLYCLSADGAIVRDNEDPPVQPVTYAVSIDLQCRTCGYERTLAMTAAL